nr:caspase 21, apoptosis-related cysteine peptidase isoform X2 [Misgurnus anguillicaudatus]
MQWVRESKARMDFNESEDDSTVRKPCVFETYKNHKNIGKCLIISNEHFNVSKENHTDMSCFVCVLMSHGEEGTILGSDQCSIPVKTLTMTMTSDLCPTLKGKPKLFFLQACRGMMYDHGVEADSEEAPGDFIGISDVPEVDFLCCYSTVEGYFSWRSPQKGSVFICELCKMLMDCHLEVIQILTRVNHSVANHFQSYTLDSATNKKRQMPCFASRLTKDFYLHAPEKKKR